MRAQLTMVGKETHHKAIERVAEWLELSRTQENLFINLAHELSSVPDTNLTHFDERYLQHLENNVFSDPQLLGFLERSGIDPTVIEQFETKQIPYDEVYQQWNVIEYSINELLDLTMLLKLIKQYSDQSEKGLVDSRYRLQKLVYLVNRRLVKQERAERDTAPYDHGKLEKTGFRYTYRKRKSGPYSKNLRDDTYRLYASDLIDEKLVQGESTPEITEQHTRLEISLGASGRVMMGRFSEMMADLDTDVLSEWESAINAVIEEFGPMSIEEFHNYVNDIEDVRNADDRKLLIRGRQVKYDNELWRTETTQEGLSDA
ncbi:hypothetical protein SAMN04487967_0407 [Natronorubrum sediminis]|uniref:Uncharacterized protein n=1 Tax=Natronorubrum sediminis TaxID=640943 RepID=A0A1H6FN52_9EURY|nr:hypothetical protein [Natronorubrum sediminis]SEH11558.1 hypothetical protein SAMN04487967_0407 [Natronorubrum sediminis]